MERNKMIGAVLGLVALGGLLAYANTVTGEFVWDDNSSVLINEHIQDPAYFFQLFREDQHPFGRGQGNFYRPLVAASFMGDFLLSYPAGAPVYAEGVVPNVSPFVFHLTNMIWHALAAVFLALLVARLGAPWQVTLAVGLLYVVHPLHTEATAYISGRADPMSAAFGFAGLWTACYRGPLKRRAIWHIAAIPLFAAGLMSKESGLIFPFLLLVIVALRGRREGETWRRTLWQGVPVAAAGLALVALYGVLRATVLNFGGEGGGRNLGVGARMIETFQAFALYVKLIFVPAGLHMERTLEGVPTAVAGLGVLLFFACLALLVAGIYKKRPLISIGMAWFLLGWLPISGIFPLNAPMAEHWLFVPLGGFLLALVSALWPFMDRPALRPAAAVVLAALALAALAATVDRNRDWGSKEGIYLSTLAHNPKSQRVQYNAGLAYEIYRNNPYGARRHYANVAALYEKQRQASPAGAPQTMPDLVVEAYVSAGNMSWRVEDVESAMRFWGVVTRRPVTQAQAPVAADAFLGFGRGLLTQGRASEARRFLEQAKKLYPPLGPEADRLLPAAAS